MSAPTVNMTRRALLGLLGVLTLTACGMSEYDHVVHPGRDDGTGFWNVNADWFMYAPSFAFCRVDGAARYRFSVIDRSGVEQVFEASRPTEPLSSVWGQVPTGDVRVRCEGVDALGRVVGFAGERKFWKAEGFREGAYPPAVKSYRATAKAIYDYVFSKRGTKILLETGKVDLTDAIASYASKYCASLINAMVDYAALEPTQKETALKIAVCAADYLTSVSEPSEAPLADFPATYAGPGECNTGTANAGQIMLCYPALAGLAYHRLWQATRDARFLDRAERIAATYLRLQGKDGTWFLKMRTCDGSSVSPNRLVPVQSAIPLLETLFETTGKTEYRAAADRAFAYVDRNLLLDWNWEGQFEDVKPSRPYENLTKHDACSTAIYLGRRFAGDDVRLGQMRELLRFAEDQFVCWVPPHDGAEFKSRTTWQASKTYAEWVTPCVLEQYGCYWPIDASAAKLIRTYLALYKAEGRSVDLAKAKALGDSMTRMQKPDGSLPTWWHHHDGRGNNWLNCMIASANALTMLANASGEP